MRDDLIKSLQRGSFFAIGAAAVLLVSSLVAVTVTGVINSFSSGETLTAAKLNENFNSLKTAIESDTTLILKDSSGAEIGKVVWPSMGGGNAGDIKTGVISKNGYFFQVSATTGYVAATTIGSIGTTAYYSNSGCSIPINGVDPNFYGQVFLIAGTFYTCGNLFSATTVFYLMGITCTVATTQTFCNLTAISPDVNLSYPIPFTFVKK